jgi:hypothetical protein
MKEEKSADVSELCCVEQQAATNCGLIPTLKIEEESYKHKISQAHHAIDEERQ